MTSSEEARLAASSEERLTSPPAPGQLDFNDAANVESMLVSLKIRVRNVAHPALPIV